MSSNSINIEMKMQADGSANGYQNNPKLCDMNVKNLEYDFPEKVPNNCCLLEIKPIYDPNYSIND